MSIKRTVAQLIDTVFPMRADARVVAAIDEGEFADAYVPYVRQDFTALLPFADARVRACIHEVKFHDNRRAAHLLGAILHTHLRSYKLHAAVIIPVPLSTRRYRKRRYNQVQRILDAATASASVDGRTLIRTRDTTPQTSLPKAARLENVADAFSLRDQDHARQRLSGRHLILVDDVATTGATLQAAKAALLPLGPASVTCLALAH